MSSTQPIISVSPSEFAEVFPFHIAIDRNLCIRQVGRSLSKLCPELAPGASLQQLTEVQSPNVELTFEDLSDNLHLLFVLKTKAMGMQLRGQVVFSQQPGLLIFLCSPWLIEQQSLKQVGLTMNDFAIHDPVVDLLQVIQASRTALTDSQNLAALIKEKQKELEAEKNRAEAANHAKSQFLANMSHELRTPLNAVIGFSQMLSERLYGELNDKQDRYIGNILTSGKLLLRLINDVLDLSKVESGNLELHTSTIQIDELLADVKSIGRSLVHKKNIDILVEHELETDRLVADEQKLKQILYNLVSNATKFTEPGGSVTIRIVERYVEGGERQATLSHHHYLHFKVIDTGIGIPRHKCEDIFEEFSQVDSSLARQSAGTGLGLALVRRLVSLHQGCVWAESEGQDGNGSTFHVLLPITGPIPDVIEKTLEDMHKDHLLVRQPESEADWAKRLPKSGRCVRTVTRKADFFAELLRDHPGVILLVLKEDDDAEPLSLELRQARAIFAEQEIPVLLVTSDGVNDASRNLFADQVEAICEDGDSDMLAQVINDLFKVVSTRGKVGKTSG